MKSTKATKTNGAYLILLLSGLALTPLFLSLGYLIYGRVQDSNDREVLKTTSTIMDRIVSDIEASRGLTLEKNKDCRDVGEGFGLFKGTACRYDANVELAVSKKAEVSKAVGALLKAIRNDQHVDASEAPTTAYPAYSQNDEAALRSLSREFSFNVRAQKLVQCGGAYSVKLSKPESDDAILTLAMSCTVPTHGTGYWPRA
ncbi:hypothetical protein JNJ66_00265 [Candidatus Saccharibacteria bacterium]|nr:hypothetical protein [Candidatus Saccharibacteria bacterium]